ncbi:DUF4150 domain-containing protein [Chondromyces crocatus]|uniref:Type VI secretion protein n=1 Tax=Chondromyces crocatus TaxID=52 RepID=A0A0K1EPA4_CHOCO|nr:DUF4150 domain-containing protein [Chondromyces crocatus]AKT42453.1 type VI secretion protein [Chondromyces crocatus]
MFANTQMMGVDMGFPDVCLTPPVAVPIPYPNIALGPMTVPAVYNVLMFCAPAHNLFSTVVMTNGDNSGVMLGVASGMVMGPSRRLTGAFTVICGGAPLQRLTSFGIQNSTNCPGVRIVPSQLNTLVLAP